MYKSILSLFIFFLVLFSDNTNAQESETKDLIVKLQETNSNIKSKNLIKRILKNENNYDLIVNYIQNCDYYSHKEVKKGFVEWEYNLDSLNYYTILLIPNNYNPQKKYKVSVILHGGVATPNPQSVRGFITPNTYDYNTLDQIIIYPAGWIQSQWWNTKQTKNLEYIIRQLKQTYNVDENNIHLSGISDGGTGIIYQANLSLTLWASFRPYISNPYGLEYFGNKPIFIRNLGNRPFLFISSEQDELFPISRIRSFCSLMDKSKNKYTLHIAKGYKHNIDWFPNYKDTVIKFTTENPRNPYSNKVFWQTNDLKFARNNWLIIDKIYNKTSNISKEDVLVPFNYSGETNCGSVLIEADNNNINIKTENIKQLTLLLSPFQFDFSKEISVYINNTLSFKGTILKDPKVLLKWFSKDIDRTMLFGNELTLKVND